MGPSNNKRDVNVKSTLALLKFNFLNIDSVLKFYRSFVPGHVLAFSFLSPSNHVILSIFYWCIYGIHEFKDLIGN